MATTTGSPRATGRPFDRHSDTVPEGVELGTQERQGKKSTPVDKDHYVPEMFLRGDRAAALWDPPIADR